VVDYRKVNSKVVYDSYPWILDLNSAYCQVALYYRSRQVTDFCTPFGHVEFNKSPMGISVGYQRLSSVIDELFVIFKGMYVFNFLNDLIVYSSTIEERRTHICEV
jgi:hypothetical protein